MGRASDEPLARWEAVTPTVHECLADLTEEVSQVIEWAGIAVDDDGHYDAAALEKAMAAWGLTPLTFLAAALKRRNPARTAAAVRAARAKKDAMARATYDAPATIFDASLGAVLSRYPPRPNSANRQAEGEEAADVAGGFGEFAAAALVGRLAAGAVYSGGTQLKLLWCDGDEAVLTLPSPPPPPPPEAALAEELALARSRIDAAMPAVLGTEQPPLPRRALAAGEVRLPLDQLAGWLQGGRWAEHGLGADFARGLHTELLSRTFTDPSYARSLLRVDRGALDLAAGLRRRGPSQGQKFSRSRKTFRETKRQDRA
ncbi:hypothetical protein AB1Y20_006320 [Prymnesium parvum]|uniref:Uncharacterized protein n=1 Tax=Prymnesium parvum TaxID=97485 RepID=A0AB34J2E4_PRYPA